MVLDFKSAILSTAERIQKLKVFKCDEHKGNVSQGMNGHVLEMVESRQNTYQLLIS